MSFALLALICAVALLGPVVSLNRFAHIPVVIGELAVGMLLGTSGLGVVDATDPVLSFMAEIGFALVMFVAGTHVPLREPAMAAGLRVGVLRALGVGLLAAPLGVVIAQQFGTGHGPLYAVLIASSSAGIVLPMLGGVRVTTRAGLELLVQLAVADAACIVALPLVLDPAHAGRAALGALAVLALAALFFGVLWWAQRRGLRERVHQVSERRGLAVELRVTLTLLFTLAAVAATVSVSVMLAGFAMGLAMSAAGEPRRVANQAFALTEGFFAPIFFVWLGSSLDLRSIGQNPSTIGLGVALGLAAVLAHGVLALTRQPLPIALTATAQLGVPVGAATLGKSMGVLVDGEATAMLLGALITIAVVTAVSGRVVALVCDPDGATQ
ncbi:cation:proton antiporter [Micropruina sp.]|uniref:cation:proton antiporter n=1 Tax=Micropruina sp. TaxID=2737536 RepID=UPI0039E29F26